MPQNHQKLRTDTEELRETVCSCAEEFARMGHNGPAILRMFQNPFYRAAYAAYRALGHAASAAIINECLAMGRSRCGAPVAAPVGPPTRRPGPQGRTA